MPRVLVIDNYDSFVYNIVQYLGELGAQPEVVRNDQLSVQEALELKPHLLLLSPGPGRPEDAGILCDSITAFAKAGIPVFGVCLGHQAIGHVFGGSVVRAPHLMHGKTSMVTHDGQGVFAGLPNPFQAGRYHSLVIADVGTHPHLVVSARTEDDGTIMGVRHVTYPIHGVQFHPESVLTGEGKHLLRNFLEV